MGELTSEPRDIHIQVFLYLDATILCVNVVVYNYKIWYVFAFDATRIWEILFLLANKVCFPSNWKGPVCKAEFMRINSIIMYDLSLTKYFPIVLESWKNGTFSEEGENIGLKAHSQWITIYDIRFMLALNGTKGIST